MAKKKVSSLSKSAADWVHGRYRGLWGFIDSRIQIALISEAVIMHVRIDDRRDFEGKSAAWLIENIDLWIQETASVLSKRYNMRLSE